MVTLPLTLTSDTVSSNAYIAHVVSADSLPWWPIVTVLALLVLHQRRSSASAGAPTLSVTTSARLADAKLPAFRRRPLQQEMISSCSDALGGPKAR